MQATVTQVGVFFQLADGSWRKLAISNCGNIPQFVPVDGPHGVVIGLSQVAILPPQPQPAAGDGD